jgi:predicted metal-dependent HD superfamily phosphohydrolase
MHKMSRNINLEDEWARDMAALGIAADNAAPVFDEIRSQYASSLRHYHGLTHLRALLDLLQTYSPQPPGSPARLAIWWHDAIYDPLSSQNEVESAILAQSHLTQLGAKATVIERVCLLIEATKNHFSAPSFGSDDVFLDADIAILGAPHDVYMNYTKQIRAEYEMVPEPLFSMGRKQFLQNATKRPRIFKTDIYENAFGAQARANLARELEIHSTV